MLQLPRASGDELKYPFVPGVVKLIDEALQKPEMSTAAYKEIIREIQEHLSRKVEPEKMFEPKSNAAEIGVCKRVLEFIAPDVVAKPPELKIKRDLTSS